MATTTEITSRIKRSLSALLYRLREAQPIFERLNLYRPTVSLDIPSTTAAD